LLLFLDPGSGLGKNQDPGSGINIPDPQHCKFLGIVTDHSAIAKKLKGCARIEISLKSSHIPWVAGVVGGAES
jgi:hypothetical protein